MHPIARLAILSASITLMIACSTTPSEPRTTPSLQTFAGHEYDGVQLAATAAAAQDLPVELRVDEGRTLAPAARSLFGINHSWTCSEKAMVGQDGRPAADYLRLLHDVPMPLNRIGGTDSAFFRWKQAVGPMAERTPIPDDYNARSVRRMGPFEWMQAVLAVDATATFCWTFNCVDEEPADHADLAEFLVGIPGENRNGGVDWAAKRAEMGRREPFPVAIYEIGNEVDACQYHRQKFPDAKTFADYARRTIAAVRKTDPQARFAVTAASAPWGWRREGDWRTWHRTMLTEIGADLEYLVFHPYYDGLPIANIEEYLDILRDDCRRLVPQRPIRLFLSEHARWPEQLQGRQWKENWFRTHCLEGCLSTARFLLRMQQRPEVGAATYHSFTSGPWGLVYDFNYLTSQPEPLWRTGMADLFALLHPLASGSVLAVEARGARTDPAKGGTTFAASAVRDGRRLLLAVANGEATAARPATFHFDRRWRLAGGRMLSAPGLESRNAAGRADIAVTPISAGQGPLTAWTVPARSMCLLELEPEE